MVREEINYRMALQQIEEATTEREAMVAAREFAAEGRHNLLKTVDSIENLVTTMAGLPGRRAALFVSDGFSPRPGEELFEVVAHSYDSTRPFLEVASYDESDRLLELSAHCNASRVTFYTVEAAGLRAPISWRIDHSLLREASVDFTVETNREVPLA